MQFKSHSVVQCYRLRWAVFAERDFVETLPRPHHLFSTILRVSSLMMMDPARLQLREAKPGHVSMMAFSIGKSDGRSNVHLPHLECRTSAIRSGCRHPSMRPRTHVGTVSPPWQPHPQSANAFNNHTPCALGRCGDQPCLGPPPPRSWSEPEPSPYF